MRSCWPASSAPFTPTRARAASSPFRPWKGSPIRPKASLASCAMAGANSVHPWDTSDGRRELSPSLVSLILDTVDATRKVLGSIEATGEEGPDRFEDLTERLQIGR